jgi:hypothetical protein
MVLEAGVRGGAVPGTEVLEAVTRGAAAVVAQAVVLEVPLPGAAAREATVSAATVREARALRDVRRESVVRPAMIRTAVSLAVALRESELCGALSRWRTSCGTTSGGTAFRVAVSWEAFFREAVSWEVLSREAVFRPSGTDRSPVTAHSAWTVSRSSCG